MTSFLILTLIMAAGALDVFAQFSRPNLVEWQLGVLQNKVKPLYRKPTREELKSVEPSSKLLDKYAEFLRQQNTGLTKLINDKGCSENTKVISASEDCLRYTLPGGGSSFSFREGTYRLSRLADVTFTENSFQASGIILHGIFVKLGDVPVSDVTLQTKGLKFLVDFQPEPDYARARDLDKRLARGVESEGFLYRRGLYAVDETTYALRSVAYGGKNYRAANGVTFNEFDYDKRSDVIVVFRIVERDGDGNITILWKKLQEKESPKVDWKSSKMSKTISLENGIPADGYCYYKAVKAVPGHTYAWRSVAYRGKLIYDIVLGKEHYKFDLLGHDVRGDMIVIFRFIGKDDRGNAKIIWRIFNSGESPKLDLPELTSENPQIKVRRIAND